MTTERTPKHHNVLVKCRMQGVAIPFRIPPCATYHTAGHVVNFKQYWLLLAGDIDYISNGIGEKKIVSKYIVEKTESKRHATAQIEFTLFYETKIFIREMRSYVRSRITRQHHINELILSNRYSLPNNNPDSSAEFISLLSCTVPEFRYNIRITRVRNFGIIYYTTLKINGIIILY